MAQEMTACNIVSSNIHKQQKERELSHNIKPNKITNETSIY